MDIVTYALCKKIAAGAVSGIKSYRIDGLTLVMTTNDGQELRINFPTPVPADIDITEVNNEAHLIFTLADGSIIDAGVLPTEVQISKADGNRLEKKSDGLYVGSDSLKLPLTATVEVGSVKAGHTYAAGTSLEAIIRDILINEVAPDGTLSHIPADKFYDIITDSVEDLTLKIKTIKGTYEIVKIDFYVNDVIVSTVTATEDEPILDDTTYTYAHHFDDPATSTIKLKVVLTDTQGLKGNPNTLIKFVGRSYFGIVPNAVVIPTEDDVKGLEFSTLKDTKSLTFKNIEVPQDGELYKVLYAYPKEFGKVTKIVDADGRDYTNSYTMNEIVVDEMNYYSFILTKGAGASGATQKFS